MKYKSLKNNSIQELDFEIRPISLNDMESIRVWRNQQMDVLRQKKVITKEEQVFYFNNYIIPTFNQKFPNQIIFSFLKSNVLIGYGGLVHISWEDKRAEMSFLLNPDYILDSTIYKEYFQVFIKFMKIVSFQQLNFHKLFTETYSQRKFHISILEECGFEIEGILRDHINLNNKYINSLIHSIINNV